TFGFSGPRYILNLVIRRHLKKRRVGLPKAQVLHARFAVALARSGVLGSQRKPEQRRIPPLGHGHNRPVVPLIVGRNGFRGPPPLDFYSVNHVCPELVVLKGGPLPRRVTDRSQGRRRGCSRRRG